MFKDEFMKYYTHVLSNIFETQKADISKAVQKYYFFLFREFEFKNLDKLDGFLKKYYQLLESSLREKSTLKGLEFDKRLSQLLNYIKLYFTDINKFIQQVRNNLVIYRALVNGYIQGLRQKEVSSLVVQELFFPSEVICVYSETGNLSKIYKAFKKI
jgi:hypothetical protein